MMDKYIYFFLQLPSRAAACDQARDSSNACMWCSHGSHFYVYGAGGYCIQPIWEPAGKHSLN